MTWVGVVVIICVVVLIGMTILDVIRLREQRAQDRADDRG